MIKQQGFFQDWQPDHDENSLISDFIAQRRLSGSADSTVKAEASQLRSMGCDARALGLSLRELLAHPEEAANLIEAAGASLHRTTVLARIRAYQRLVIQMLGQDRGAAILQRFSVSMPQHESLYWHDSGMSVPGRKSKSTRRAPTPDGGALEAILAAAASKTRMDGAIAAFACFSGLELGAMRKLRWRDIKWQDEEGSTYCEVRLIRRARKTHCFVVPIGAKTILAYAVQTGLERDAYIFPGRSPGEPMSVGALKNRIRDACEVAGWSGLTRSQLTAAFVDWLRVQGLDDHSIRLVLGRRRAATVDRLSRHSKAISAQLQIDAAVERDC